MLRTTASAGFPAMLLRTRDDVVVTTRLAALGFVLTLALLCTGCFSAQAARPAQACPTVPASEVKVGVSTPQGLSGNSYVVRASLQVGQYIWVTVVSTPWTVYSPGISYPLTTVDLGASVISYPDTSFPAALQRVCNQASALENRTLFLAQRVGVAEVDAQPRPTRAAMIGYAAQITVVAKTSSSAGTTG
jgi:hypothetical protein